MARNRMLNPEFWLDEELAKTSSHARLLYMGTWGICDDNYATFPNRPEWIKAQVFPYDDVNTRGLLDELSKIGKIILFEEDGQEFWFIKNFFKHQRVDRPSKPKFPAFNKGNVKNNKTLDEDSTRARTEVKLSKDKISKENVADKSASPDFKDIIAYYHTLVLNSEGFKPEIRAKDCALVKSILKRYPKDQVKDIIYHYLSGEKAGKLGIDLSIALSAHSINQYLSKK